MRRSLTLALLLAACSTAPTPEPSPAPAATATVSIGSTREAAIEVCEPEGEQDYLARLRCADGSTPEVARMGSYGSRTTPESVPDERMAEEQTLGGAPVPPGGKDFHTLDKYMVRCGEMYVEVFVDMYHCDQPPPAQAPAGLTIVR